MEPEYQALDLRPRYHSPDLEQRLRNRVAQLKALPIEYLESQLYRLTYEFVGKLGGKPLALSAVKDLHHIYQLKTEEATLTSEEVEDLNLNLELLLNERPSVLGEYKLLAGLLSLSSALLVQWKLWSPLHSAYKTGPLVSNIPLLDMQSLNSDLMTMDTVWLSHSVHEPPLQYCVSEGVKQLATVLQTELLRMFSYMLRMNDVDFRKQPSIDGYLAARVPAFRSQFHVAPDYSRVRPTYQQLRLSTCCLYRSRSDQQALHLRKLLRDSDYAYRAFERSLLSNLLSLHQQSISA